MRLVVFALLLGSFAARASLVVYPLDPDHKSDGLVSGSLDSQPVTFEYQHTYRVNPASTLGQEDFKANYVRFAADKPVKVELTVNAAITNAFLRTLGKDLPFTRNGSNFTFTLPGPGNYHLQLPDLDTPSNITYHVVFFYDSLTNYNAYQQAFVTAKNVTSNGVVSHPTLDQTAAVQAVLNGGGEIYFPPGIYRTGRLTNKSDTTVYLAPGALLKGTETYPDSQFINIFGRQNVRYAGLGVIDPNGLTNTLATCHGIDMELSTNVAVDDVLFRNSNSWMLHIRRCQQVQMRRVKVFSGKDGIDPDGSTDVLIEGAFIQSVDDSLCVKSRFSGYSCERVTMRDCIAFSCASAFKVGTENRYGVVRDIVWDNCDGFADRGCILWVENPLGVAPISNVTWSNIRFFGFPYAIEIAEAMSGGAPFWFRDQPNTLVTNVQAWNVEAWPLANCRVQGTNQSVTLRNVIMHGSSTMVTNASNKGVIFSGVMWSNVVSQSRPVVFITPGTRNQNEFANGDAVTVTVQHPFGKGIAQVQLLADGILQGTRTNAPYQFTLAGLTNGLYQLQATATDADGATNATAPKRILIVPGGAVRFTNAVISGVNFLVSGTGQPSQTLVLQAATNLLSVIAWTPIATNAADANGVFQFTDPQVQNFQRRFYRAMGQ